MEHATVFGEAFREPAAVVEVPEGRHIVAHHVSGGRVDGTKKSPGGATHSLDETECAAPPGLVSPPPGFPPFHGGLRCAVPPGLSSQNDLIAANEMPNARSNATSISARGVR